MTRPVRILFFASLRDRLGRRDEEALLPDEVRQVGDLKRWMSGRDASFAAMLGEGRAIRVAVNQEFARDEDPVAAGDEIAFFPPVTGG